MRPRAYFVFVCAALFPTGAVSIACNGEDPPVWKDGPAFLIVGQAAKQTSAGAGETRLYVQARGGDYVGIVTRGGTHSLGALPSPAATSCAILPGSDPLYIDIKAEDPDCDVEVRLYSICDGASVRGDVIPLQICETEGTLVTVQSARVQGAVRPTDGGTDG